MVVPRQDGELQTGSADDHGGAGRCGQSHRICQRAGRPRAVGGPHLLFHRQTTYNEPLRPPLLSFACLYVIVSPPAPSAFITGLLNNIGTHVDPILLIHRIKEGMEIPNLRDSLVKILQDYNLQVWQDHFQSFGC